MALLSLAISSSIFLRLDVTVYLATHLILSPQDIPVILTKRLNLINQIKKEIHLSRLEFRSSSLLLSEGSQGMQSGGTSWQVDCILLRHEESWLNSKLLEEGGGVGSRLHFKELLHFTRRPSGGSPSPSSTSLRPPSPWHTVFRC